MHAFHATAFAFALTCAVACAVVDLPAAESVAPADYAPVTDAPRWPPPPPAIPELDADEWTAVESRRARVTLSGRAWVGVYAGRYDAGMPTTPQFAGMAPGDLAAAWADRNQRHQTTDFRAERAELYFDAALRENASLRIGLAFDDAWSSEPDEDDFLQDLYFEMRRLWGQPLAVRVGKMALPYGAFGVHRDDLMVGPYIADVGHSGFSGWLNDPRYPMDTAHLPEMDRTFAAVVEWKPARLRDLLTLEAGLFQDWAARDLNTARRRTNDNMLFRSWVARARFEPFDKMEIAASMISRYRDDAGDGRHNRAWSVGVASPVFIAPVVLFAEYQRSWRDGHIQGRDAHHLHTGAVWTLRPDLRLHAQYEWMHLNHDATAMASYGAGPERTTFRRTLLAAEYDLASGITLEAGWQREWYKRRGSYYDTVEPSLSGVNLARFAAGGDVLYFGVKYDF